jgi:hypothetical protein
MTVLYNGDRHPPDDQLAFILLLGGPTRIVAFGWLVGVGAGVFA